MPDNTETEYRTTGTWSKRRTRPDASSGDWDILCQQTDPPIGIGDQFVVRVETQSNRVTYSKVLRVGDLFESQYHTPGTFLFRAWPIEDAKFFDPETLPSTRVSTVPVAGEDSSSAEPSSKGAEISAYLAGYSDALQGRPSKHSALANTEAPRPAVPPRPAMKGMAPITAPAQTPQPLLSLVQDYPEDEEPF